MPCKQIMKKISEKDLTDYLSFLSDPNSPVRL